MENTDKNFKNSGQMPHNGDLLKQRTEATFPNHTRMSEQIGVTLSTLLKTYPQPSVQARTLWKASKALKHNLFFDIGMMLPNDFTSEYQHNEELIKELEKRLNELEDLKKENERLKIEISVYEKITKK